MLRLAMQGMIVSLLTFIFHLLAPQQTGRPATFEVSHAETIKTTNIGLTTYTLNTKKFYSFDTQEDLFYLFIFKLCDNTKPYFDPHFDMSVLF